MADLRSGGGGRRVTAARQAVRTERRSPRRHTDSQDSPASPARAVFAAPVPETLEARTLLSTWYVSTSGSDSADGSVGAPFRTIQQAANTAQPGDTVLVRAGTYRETVTPARSGASGRPITYKPYPGERVTVSGADRVTGWSVHSGSVYKANQGWNLGDGRNQVFVDGHMMIEARWPNTTLDISRPRKATFDGVSASSSRATIEDSALTQGEDFWNGATIHFEPGEGWVGQTGQVTDSGPGRLSFSYDSMGRKSGPTGGDTYYLSGKFRALDSATEWFRDPDGTLYLWAPDGDDPSGHTVEAKRRQDAFVLDHRSYINLEGFDVFAAGVTAQGASHLRLGNLTASYLSHWTEQDSGWSQPHDTGIYLDGDDNVITDSVVAYSAGHGIVLSGDDSRAENNVVHDVAYNAGDSAGIRTVGSGHVVTKNTVYNTGRSAMKLSNSDDLKITYNLVHDAMLQTTDGGAIYTFGMDGRGTEIAYNKIYNVRTGGYGGTGIFLDNTSSNYVLHHNIVWNANHALKLNYTSRGHKIYNNTLAGTDDSVGASSNSSMSGTAFKNNIFTKSVKIAGNASEADNLYADSNAQFVNAADGDFSLKSSSPAIDEGSTLAPYTNGYTGDAPDIGALEYGKAPFRAGANLSIRTPVVPPPINQPPAGGGTGGGGTGGSGDSGGGTDGGSDPGTDTGGTPTDPATPPVTGPVAEEPTPVPAAPAEGISVGEVSFVRMPARLVGGQRRARGRVQVVLHNEGTTPASGRVRLTLLASPDAVASPDTDLVIGHARRRVKLAPGESKAVSVRIRLTPPEAGGDYVILASAEGTGVSTRSVGQSSAPLRVEAPTVDLAGPPVLESSLEFGKRMSVVIPVTNRGNVIAAEPINVELRLSPDGTVENSVVLATLESPDIAIRPGQTKNVRLHVTLTDALPILLPGVSYSLIATVVGTGQVLTTIPLSTPG
jgi:hypothetical protein